MTRLEALIKELPPELQQEVEDYVQLLLKKQKTNKQKKLSLSWAGALREYRDQYTSLELQKKALEWWGD
jgi:hypothetical protein